MFDPYLEWLEIPKDKRPPTLYQLLGVASSEEDPQKIERAFLARTEKIRQYQNSRYVEHCSQILNELSTAAEVLLDPRRRAAYDRDLLLNRPATVPPVPERSGAQTMVRLPLWLVACMAGLFSLPLAVLLTLLLQSMFVTTPQQPVIVQSEAVEGEAQEDSAAAKPAPNEDDDGAGEERPAVTDEKPSIEEKAIPPEPESKAPADPESSDPGSDEDPGEAKPLLPPAPEEPPQPEPADRTEPADNEATAKAEESSEPGAANAAKPADQQSPDEDALDLDPVTEQTFQIILEREWEGRKADTVRTVRKAVTDAYRNEGDMLLVNFAHTLFFMNRQMWSDADRSVKQALRRDDRFGPAWIASATIELRRDNLSTALQSIERALLSPELEPLTCDTLAVLDGFFDGDLPTLSLRRKLESMVDETQGRLDSEQARRFREVRLLGKQYREDLPKYRESVLAKLQPHRDRLSEWQIAVDAASRELLEKQNQLQEIQRQGAQVLQLLEQTSANYDAQIQAALAIEDFAMAQRLRNMKATAVANFQAQYQRLDRQAANVRRATAPIQQQLQTLEKNRKELQTRIDKFETTLDAALEAAPTAFAIETERRRLLTGKPPGRGEKPQLDFPAIEAPDLNVE